MTKKVFEDTLQHNAVVLSKDEIGTLFDTFGSGAGRVNYENISMALGLHKKNFELMKTTH